LGKAASDDGVEAKTAKSEAMCRMPEARWKEMIQK
jgi:hypothetical protein